MISKYNRYNIILICLLCNSIIAISEQQSLTDQPIVDNIQSNDPIDSSLEHKESHNQDNQDNIQYNEDNEDNQKNNEPNDESNPQSIESSQLSQSLKGSKHKTVINKSKESSPLNKGAKISLGAIVGVGGVGLLIRPSRKSSTSSSSSNLIGTSTSLNQGEIFQESGSRTLQKNSSERPLEQEQYYSLHHLPELNDLFKKLQEKDYEYSIDPEKELEIIELEIINKNFRKLKIKEKINWILFFWHNNIVVDMTLKNITFKTKHLHISIYLISLVNQQEIELLVNDLTALKPYSSQSLDKFSIYMFLQLLNIIVKYVKNVKHETILEFFIIFCKDEFDLVKKNKKTIDEIIEQCKSQLPLDDLFVFYYISCQIKLGQEILFYYAVTKLEENHIQYLIEKFKSLKSLGEEKKLEYVCPDEQSKTYIINILKDILHSRKTAIPNITTDLRDIGFI